MTVKVSKEVDGATRIYHWKESSVSPLITLLVPNSLECWGLATALPESWTLPLAQPVGADESFKSNPRVKP